MTRHSFQAFQKFMLLARHRIPLICLVREEPVTLGPRDQGKVPRMLGWRSRVMLTDMEAEPFRDEFSCWGLAP